MKVSNPQHRAEYIKSILDGGKTQKQIIEDTGIPRSTVNDITKELRRAGVVEIEWKKRKRIYPKKDLNITEIRILAQFFNSKDYSYLMDSETGRDIITTMTKEIKNFVDQNLTLKCIEEMIDEERILSKFIGELHPLYAFEELDLKTTCTCLGRVPPKALEPEAKEAVEGLRSGDIKTAQNAGERLLNYYRRKGVKIYKDEITSLRGDLLKRISEVFKVSPGALTATIDLITRMNKPKKPQEHLENYLSIVEAILNNTELETIKLTHGSIDIERTLEKRKPSKEMTIREIAEDMKGRETLTHYLFPFDLDVFDQDNLNNFNSFVKSGNNEATIQTF